MAACAAEVFSLAQGLRLVAARGRLMQALPAGGAMVSLQAPAQQLQQALAEMATTLLASAKLVAGPRVARSFHKPNRSPM